MNVLQQILEEIENERGKEEDYERLSDKQLVCRWNSCIDVIKEIIKSHFNDDWIPVEEGLPEYCEYIIPCFVELKRKESECSFRTRINWCKGNWQWSNGKTLSDKYQVLAWQKIEYPTPYKAKGNT